MITIFISCDSVVSITGDILGNTVGSCFDISGTAIPVVFSIDRCLCIHVDIYNDIGSIVENTLVVTHASKFTFNCFWTTFLTADFVFKVDTWNEIGIGVVFLSDNK